MRTYAELTDDQSYLWEVECALQEEDHEESIINDEHSQYSEEEIKANITNIAESESKDIYYATEDGVTTQDTP